MKKKSEKKQTKSSLIRAFPASTPVKDVIAALAKKGVKVTYGSIYVARKVGKKAAKAAASPATPKRKYTRRIPAINSNGNGRLDVTNDFQAKLFAIATEIGLGTSIDLLTSKRATNQAVLS